MKKQMAVGVGLFAFACAQMLGLGPRARPFEHREHLLVGVNCLECHESVREAGEEGALHLPGADKCLSCHGDPHDRRECGLCHGLPSTADRVAMARTQLRFAHANHLSDLRGQCVPCHVEVRTEDSMLLPPMSACLECHVHAREFEVRDCASCHVDVASEGVRPASHAVHGIDFVRSHGARASSSRDLCETCHSERFCSGCHAKNVPARPEERLFASPGLPGLHRAGFRSRHEEEARAQPATCATCHDEASCERCHADKGLSATAGARRSPHPPGWVGIGPGQNTHGPASRREPFSCAACHGGAGEQLCASCHRVGGIGGSVHPPGWSRDRRSMTESPCRLCHGVMP